MNSVTFPNHVDDSILQGLNDLARRAIDGTVKPCFVDYPNQRVGINTSSPDHPLCVSSTAGFHSDILVTGTLTSIGSMTMGAVTAGSLTVTGNTRLAAVTGTNMSLNNLTASGSIYLGSVTAGNVTVTGLTKCQGELTTTANFYCFSTAFISSALNVSGDTSITGSGMFTGKIDARGAVNVTGDLTITGSTYTKGAFTAVSTAHFNSAVNVTGQLNSTGSANFLNVTAGLVNITSTASFRSDVNVTGALNVTGVATLTLGSVTANTLVVTGNTDLANVTASTIQLETSLGGVGNAMVKNTIYADNVCKGWINFNAATDAIADSFNVLSITDGAAGFDTINWDLDFATASYSVGFGLNEYHMYINSQLAGSIQVAIRDSANNAADTSIVTICAFGDQ